MGFIFVYVDLYLSTIEVINPGILEGINHKWFKLLSSDENYFSDYIFTDLLLRFHIDIMD